MEFERSVYRIYEKTIEGFADRSNAERANKYCKLLEFVLLSIAMFYLWDLIFIHHKYIGRAGCLPTLLHGGPLHVNDSQRANTYSLSRDEILQLQLEPALRNARQSVFGDSTWGDSDDESGSLAHRLRPIGSTVITMVNRWLKSTDKNHHGRKNKTDAHVDKWENYSDFEFARVSALVLLPQHLRKSHSFRTYNYTMDTHQCFGSDLVQLALPSDGINVITMNMITFTFLETGVLKISPVDSFREIEASYYKPFRNFGLWVKNRIMILLRSLLSFLFVSTATSLMIRVLVSSGVVVLFPIFWLFRLFGADRNLLHPRIIALSYPWIGIPMEVIRNTGVSSIPYIFSHFIRLVVYYFMFQATQLLMSLLFYEDDVPGVMDMWLFAIVMTSEYFSMVYVRSVKSIQVFPRMTLAFFLLYHFYIYLHPTGFHLMGLWVFFLFELVLMLGCIVWFEIPAFQRGEVTLENPRALHNSLPWPTWQVSLAPEYSLFLPVTHRSINIYGDLSGSPPAENESGNDRGVNEGSTDGRRDEDNVTMNVLHTQRRGDRSNSDDSLDVEFGVALVPIAISSSARAQGSEARARLSQAYAALNASDDATESTHYTANGSRDESKLPDNSY